MSETVHRGSCLCGTIRFEIEGKLGPFGFCPNCGSPIYKEMDDTPGVIRIRLGILDTPVGAKPQAHAFWGEKADWYDDPGDMPVYEAWAPVLKGK